jgi:hypothetical protein
MSSGSSITVSFEKYLHLRENKSLLMFELSSWFKTLWTPFSLHFQCWLLTKYHHREGNSIKIVSSPQSFHAWWKDWHGKPRCRLPAPHGQFCDNGEKITRQLVSARFIGAPHPPYWPDLNPCDFWLFGLWKESMMSMEWTTENHIIEAITTMWRGVTSKILQSVFQEWMRQLIWVIDNNKEYYF